MTRIVLPAVLGATCVGLFVFAAKQEDLPRWFWGGLSLALWLLCWLAFDGGVLLILLGQAVLFAAMWVYLLRKADRR